MLGSSSRFEPTVKQGTPSPESFGATPPWLTENGRPKGVLPLSAPSFSHSTIKHFGDTLNLDPSILPNLSVAHPTSLSRLSGRRNQVLGYPTGALHAHRLEPPLPTP